VVGPVGGLGDGQGAFEQGPGIGQAGHDCGAPMISSGAPARNRPSATPSG
jgi:hypothetical protein